MAQRAQTKRKKVTAPVPSGGEHAEASLTLRVPKSLLQRIDREAERLREAQPGVYVSRASAVRAALERALPTG